MNTQPISKVDKEGDGKSLLIHSIFYTIQGEGPFAGTPAVFIRLAGCNLRCPGCDTEYTQGANWQYVNTIIEMVTNLLFIKQENNMHEPGSLVVITGGEPFRQPIELLVKTLIYEGFKVQIETNGTLFRELHWCANLTVVCSPKTGKINAELWPHIDALKYVGRASDLSLLDGLPVKALGHSAKPILARVAGCPEIYLQPMDEKDEELNRKNMEAVKESCLKFGYRLCLQLHKIIGVD